MAPPWHHLTRYRVNMSVAGLHHGELVDIDDTLPEWRECISLGWLVLADDVTPPDLDTSVVESVVAKSKAKP